MHDDQHSHFRLGVRAGAVLFLLATAALAGFQCGGGAAAPAASDQATSDQATSDQTDRVPAGAAAADSAVPGDLRIIVGSGGGFTGRWDGYLIEADGQVWSWSGIGVPTDTTQAGVLPADSLAALWTEIRTSSFFSDSTAQSGNITAILEVTADGETHRSTWIPNVDELEPPKSPTEALYRRARHLAAGASH